MGGEIKDVSACLETSFTLGVCSMCVCFLCVAAAGRDGTSGRLSSLEMPFWKPTAV